MSKILYKFKTGDGITHLSVPNVTQREEIYKLLKGKGYPLYREYSRSESNYYGSYNEFQNNFYFNKQHKWCTAAVKAVTNPLTYNQIINLINNGGEPEYEIY